MFNALRRRWILAELRKLEKLLEASDRRLTRGLSQRELQRDTDLTMRIVNRVAVLCRKARTLGLSKDVLLSNVSHEVILEWIKTCELD